MDQDVGVAAADDGVPVLLMMDRIIDIRSDTVTQPTPEMRRAMIINLDTPPRSEVQDERAEEPRKEHSK